MLGLRVMAGWGRPASSLAPSIASRVAGAVRSMSDSDRIPSNRPPKELGPKKEKKITGLALALPQLKIKSWAKFDESVDIAIRLNIDPRKPEQAVRGLAVLPKGTGKNVRVAVFATGSHAEEATKFTWDTQAEIRGVMSVLRAGASVVGGEDLIDRVKEGFMEFDRCVATPAMMKSMSKVARILGPRGLMPNPKLGTVTEQVGMIVSQLRSGITFKAEKAGIVHAIVGKKSFSGEDLLSNIEALVKAIQAVRPRGIKDPFFKSVFLSATMSESIKLDPTEVSRLGSVAATNVTANVELATSSGQHRWVDKAKEIDWDSVDPSTVASKKLRMYLQARKAIKERDAGEGSGDSKAVANQ